MRLAVRPGASAARGRRSARSPIRKTMSSESSTIRNAVDPGVGVVRDQLLEVPAERRVGEEPARAAGRDGQHVPVGVGDALEAVEGEQVGDRPLAADHRVVGEERQVADHDEVGRRRRRLGAEPLGLGQGHRPGGEHRRPLVVQRRGGRPQGGPGLPEPPHEEVVAGGAARRVDGRGHLSGALPATRSWPWRRSAPRGPRRSSPSRPLAFSAPTISFEAGGGVAVEPGGESRQQAGQREVGDAVRAEPGDGAGGQLRMSWSPLR